MAYYDSFLPCDLFDNVLVVSQMKLNAPLSSGYMLGSPKFTEAGWASNATTVAVTAGSLPTGVGGTAPSLVWNPTYKRVQITGTPTVAGNYTFTAQATNNGNSVSQAFTLIVTATPQLYVGCQSTFAGVQNQALYFVGLTYYGPSPVVNWTGASLPAGLSVGNSAINSAPYGGTGVFGAIYGTPTGTGVFTFAVTATGSLGDITTVNCMLLIVSFQNWQMLLPPLTINAPYNFSFTQDFGDTCYLWPGNTNNAPYTYSFTFPPPAGMSVSSSGMVSGVPIASGVNAIGAYEYFANIRIQKSGGGASAGASIYAFAPYIANPVVMPSIMIDQNHLPIARLPFCMRQEKCIFV
jgi:hypothetical protein